jgi:hypothetical protein
MQFRLIMALDHAEKKTVVSQKHVFCMHVQVLPEYPHNTTALWSWPSSNATATRLGALSTTALAPEAPGRSAGSSNFALLGAAIGGAVAVLAALFAGLFVYISFIQKNSKLRKDYVVSLDVPNQQCSVEKAACTREQLGGTVQHLWAQLFHFLFVTRSS